jgi:hypothetical protein
LRIAHFLATGEETGKIYGGEPTNKYFPPLGFEIKNKGTTTNGYTWVTVYKQIAQRLFEYQNRQRELIEIIKKIGITEGLTDKTENGDAQIEEIDPFTFFSYIHKVKNLQKRKEVVYRVLDEFNIEDDIDDFDGIPTTNAFQVWYFPYKIERKPDDIATLWTLFRQTVSGTIDEETFSKVLNIPSVKEAKLTSGLFVVNPELYLPINGQTIPFLQFNGIKTDFHLLSEYLIILKVVKEKIQQPYYEVSHRAYLENTKKRFWRIGTSDGETSYWGEMKVEKVIKIGWPKLGDLREVPSIKRDTIYSMLLNSGYIYNGNNPTVSKKAGEIWSFYKEIKRGDYVVAQEGYNIFGIGIVEGGYYFDEADDFPNKRSIKWIVADKEFPQQTEGNRTTVTEITNQLIKNELIQFLEDNNEFEQQLQIKLFGMTPLNQILYGPPGTGKTYHTINHALAILENKTVEAINAEQEDSGRKVLFDRFEGYRQKGFVDFITFHQNYSYEEFVQGLRPVLGKGGEEPDALMFKKEDGIFKRLADLAYKNMVGDEVEEKQTLTFSELLSKFLEPLKRGVQIDLDLSSSKFHITSEEEKYIVFKNVNGNTFKLNKIYLEMAFLRGNMNGIIEGGLTTYYAPVLNRLKKIKDETEAEFKPIKPHNFVLIIDEINRANISRVFGELITLIEEDKRWDNEHRMKIKLPSGDEFTVPKNLYIIGTMNTADKSIALLDIALRRRFDFIPMYPNASHVSEAFQPYFNSLNESIKKERGADFAVGHAYFMNGTAEKPFDFETAMNKKVIPLLNEYFYSAKEGKVKDLIDRALRASALEGKFEIIESSLGILRIKGK